MGIFINGVDDGGRRKSGAGRTILLILFVLFLIFSIGAILALGDRTFIAWWIPCSLSLVFAVPLALVSISFWQWFTLLRNRYVNFGVGIVCFFLFLSAAFYSANFIFSSSDHKLTEVSIERKYTKTRHRSKRVGRNRYVQGEPYTVFYIDIRFPDGRERSLEIKGTEYMKCRKNGKATIETARGLFGPEVIKGMPKISGR